MALPLFTLCLVLAADEVISADKAAEITRAEQKAQAEVSKKYGNKKSSELTGAERGQMIRDQAAAEKAMLEKAGIDAKTWAREQMKKSRDEYAAGKEKVKQLEAKEKKDAADAQKAAKEGGIKDVTVQRGFSDEEPVTLEEKQNENGEVSVEKSLPPDVANDQSLASEQDRLENSGAAKDSPAPSKPAKGGKRR
jgi:hypothetical protein